MKILKVFNSFGGFYREYRLHELAPTQPNEFVKDITYRDGNYSVVFSDPGNDPWFQTFTNMPCEYLESNEMTVKSNAPQLLGKVK